MIEIPYDAMSEQALVGVIDAFVLREGTDYGHRDIPLDEKRKRVLEALHAGEAVIVYEPATEHIEIVLKRA